MGSQQITFNGKIINFEDTLARLMWHGDVIGSQNPSLSGSRETLTLHTDVRVSLFWEVLIESLGASDLNVVRKLRQLSQCGQSGEPFFVAADSSRTVNTTLSVDANEGDSSVVVSDATGITVGNEYVIRDATRLMVVKVASVAGTTIGLTAGEELDFPFATGARFRDVEYWPAKMAPGARMVERANRLHYSAALEFIEDVDDLAEGVEEGGLDVVHHVDAETPVGDIDGVNTTFELAYAPLSGSLQLFYRAAGSGAGVLWKDGIEFTLTGSTIEATVPPLVGDEFTAYYRR